MKIGDDAPDFTLKDADGSDWKLSDRRGRTVVLLFYPADNSPVCTKQLCSVGDDWEKYRASGAEIVGISTDTSASHRKFAEKYSFPFALLSDEKGAVSERYNAKSWIPGRAARAVVVIDRNGVVRHHRVQPSSLLRPKTDEILRAIQKAQGE